MNDVTTTPNRPPSNTVATFRIAADHGSFNRIHQVASVCRRRRRYRVVSWNSCVTREWRRHYSASP